jgi:hypothetical protein
VRLEVAVDDALVVRGLDRLAQPFADMDHRRSRQRPDLLEVGVQVEPCQVLAHHVLPALIGSADVVGSDDARVIDRRGRLRLALEALLQVGVHRQVGVQHLDGEALVGQARVQRLVHAAHAALAEDTAHHVCIVESHADQRIGGLRRNGQAAPRGRALVERRVLRRPRIGARRTVSAFGLADQWLCPRIG